MTKSNNKSPPLKNVQSLILYDMRLNEQIINKIYKYKSLIMQNNKANKSVVSCFIEFRKGKMIVSNLEYAKSSKSAFAKYEIAEELKSRKKRLFISVDTLFKTHYNICQVFYDKEIIESLCLHWNYKYSSNLKVSLIDDVNSIDAINKKLFLAL